MATRVQLKEMAESKILESEALLENNFYDAAYYMCGYAVEFSLKAAICNRLGVEMFNGNGIIENTSSFKIHRLNDLIILSSLFSLFNENKTSDEDFSEAWAKISVWNEQRRYKIGCTEPMAREFVEAVKIFMVWIRNYW